MTDQETETTTTDGPEDLPTETPVEDAPKIDMGAVSAATDAHDSAVQKAHENLSTRMAAAYAEFANDLDRARQIWENAYSAAKSAVSEISDLEGTDNATGDATTAR